MAKISRRISPHNPSARNILKHFDVRKHNDPDVIEELENLGFSYFKLFVADGLKVDASKKLRPYQYREFVGIDRRSFVKFFYVLKYRLCMTNIRQNFVKLLHKGFRH